MRDFVAYTQVCMYKLGKYVINKRVHESLLNTIQEGFDYKLVRTLLSDVLATVRDLGRRSNIRRDMMT